MKNLLEIAFDWGKRCFGDTHMTHKPTRSLRIVEEAIELCQAVGVDRDTVAEVLVNVYNRPRGFMVQEMGGVLLTAFLFCESQKWDPQDIFALELRRVLGKTADHFAKRNDEKIDLSKDAGVESNLPPNDLLPPQFKSPMGIDA